MKTSFSAILVALAALLFTSSLTLAQEPASKGYRLITDIRDLGGIVPSKKNDINARIVALGAQTRSLDGIPSSNRNPIVVSGQYSYWLNEKEITGNTVMIYYIDGEQIGQPEFYPEGLPARIGISIWSMQNMLRGFSFEPLLSVVAYTSAGVYRSDARIRLWSTAGYNEILGATPFVAQVDGNGVRYLYYLAVPGIQPWSEPVIRLGWDNVLDPRAYVIDPETQAIIIDLKADPTLASQGVWGFQNFITVTINGVSSSYPLQVIGFQGGGGLSESPRELKGLRPPTARKR